MGKDEIPRKASEVRGALIWQKMRPFAVQMDLRKAWRHQGSAVLGQGWWQQQIMLRWHQKGWAADRGEMRAGISPGETSDRLRIGISPLGCKALKIGLVTRIARLLFKGAFHRRRQDGCHATSGDGRGPRKQGVSGSGHGAGGGIGQHHGHDMGGMAGGIGSRNHAPDGAGNGDQAPQPQRGTQRLNIGDMGHQVRRCCGARRSPSAAQIDSKQAKILLPAWQAGIPEAERCAHGMNEQ